MVRKPHDQEKECIFTTLTESDYNAAFDAYLIDKSSQIATSLQVDGANTILRSHLGDILKALLQRIPTKEELELWFIYLHGEGTPCVMTREEYLNSVHELNRICRSIPHASSTHSFHELHDAQIKHKRTSSAPSVIYKDCILTSQETGWMIEDTRSQCIDSNSHTLKSTDVTQKEGTSLAHYYGPITLI